MTGMSGSLHGCIPGFHVELAGSLVEVQSQVHSAINSLKALRAEVNGSRRGLWPLKSIRMRGSQQLCASDVQDGNDTGICRHAHVDEKSVPDEGAFWRKDGHSDENGLLFKHLLVRVASASDGIRMASL